MVTDTHALVWYATGRVSKLGRRARQVFERAEAGQASVLIPTVVLVEVADLAQRGIYRFAVGVEAWLRALVGGGHFPSGGSDCRRGAVCGAAAWHTGPDGQTDRRDGGESGCSVGHGGCVDCCGGVSVIW